jgi:hypothetical protein
MNINLKEKYTHLSQRFSRRPHEKNISVEKNKKFVYSEFYTIT